MNWLLHLSIVDGPVIIVAYSLSIGLLGYLLLRVTKKPVSWPAIKSWGLRVLGVAVLGAMIAMCTLFMVENVLVLLDAPLTNPSRGLIILAFACIGIAILNFWGSRWWRKLIAAIAIIVFVLTAALAINASYGLNLQLGSLLGVNNIEKISLPTAPSKADGTTPPYKNWQPPKDMPKTGRVGSVIIPATKSGFSARPALLYLPPAAIVKDPPALPIIILMMGQPGSPSQAQILMASLDAFASNHNGLAPIVLTVDQLGSQVANPLCIDSRAGNVQQYVNEDVVAYARSSLTVMKPREYWAVGGYSGGGECAFSFGAKHPDIYGALLSLSGEAEPSLGSPKKTIAKGFDGDTQRYQAEKPANIIARTRYTDMVAIFTSGQNDQRYTAEAQQSSAVTKAAGITTHLIVQPGGDHGGDTIIYGFEQSLKLLAERFGLEKPTQ